MKHFRYLHYILRHKYYVARGCQRYGVSWRRAVMHDWHKFLPSEWFPYVDHFYGDGVAELDYTCAWSKHLHRADHHWQHWVLIDDDGSEELLPMPEQAAREMVADWYGAGMAIHGRNDLADWYIANKGKIRIHSQTRLLVEHLVFSKGEQ